MLPGGPVKTGLYIYNIPLKNQTYWLLVLLSLTLLTVTGSKKKKFKLTTMPEHNNHLF